jgi:hypothetical protein
MLSFLAILVFSYEEYSYFVIGRNDFGILESKIVSIAADAAANQKTKDDYEKIAEKFHVCSLIVSEWKNPQATSLGGSCRQLFLRSKIHS